MSTGCYTVCQQIEFKLKNAKKILKIDDEIKKKKDQIQRFKRMASKRTWPVNVCI